MKRERVQCFLLEFLRIRYKITRPFRSVAMKF